MNKITTFVVLTAFLFGCILPPRGLAQGLLPAPGAAITLTPAFTPAHLKGMVIDPAHPFKFDFLIHRGDEMLTEEQKRAEYPRLIKYFLASLAIPDTDQWVNLSPYEKGRIIPDNFGMTEMGHDLLAEDYLLKQIAASLTNPDTDLGRKFWDEVYGRAYQKFGTTDILADTFNKVWIIPDRAVFYEKGNTVYVLEHRLKVMMEKDYLAAKAGGPVSTPPDRDEGAAISQDVMRQIIIPAVEKEVNEGRNFARLRQVYSGMLLAAWYKRALKGSALARAYADRSNVRGVDQDPARNQDIYEQYVAAFRAGAYNMIREDVDRSTHEIIPRKYFSGGMVADGAMFERIVERAGKLTSKDLAEAGKIDASEVVLKGAFPDSGQDGGAIAAEELKLFFDAPWEAMDFDPSDALQSKLRLVISDRESSKFHKNDEFGLIMASTAAFLSRGSEKRYLSLLGSVYKARVAVALKDPDLDEFLFAQSLLAAIKSRLHGLPTKDRGVPYTRVTNSGKYFELYGKIRRRLESGGFVKESIPNGVRYWRREQIGSMGRYYRQTFDVTVKGIKIYSAEYRDIPFMTRHLIGLWDRMMDETVGMDRRLPVLAACEWWFFQANPFGRGAASMGDAMSLIAQMKMGLSIRDKYEHLDFRALFMTLPEYVEYRVAELKKNVPDHAQAGKGKSDASQAMLSQGVQGPWGQFKLPYHVPQADANDPLLQKIRDVYVQFHDKIINHNPSFAEIMPAAIMSLFRRHEKSHLNALKELLQARVLAASRSDIHSEIEVKDVLLRSLDGRMLGLPGQPPAIIVRSDGKYGASLGMFDGLNDRNAFTEYPEMFGKRFIRREPIGSTGRTYTQIIDRNVVVTLPKDVIGIHYARNEDVPYIFKHLTGLWDNIMDEVLSMDMRVSALAEYEWWFFQGLIFGRAGASIGDGMSLLAQLQMGIPIRDKYEHLDLRALSRALPEYKQTRVAELGRNVRDREGEAGENAIVQATPHDLSQDTQINTWRGFEGLAAVVVPEFHFYDHLQRKVRKIMSAPKGSGFHANYRFGAIMAAMVVSLFRSAEKSHIKILHAVFQARLSAAERGVAPSESMVANNLRVEAQTRFLGVPDDLVPATFICDSDRYQDLHRMVLRRLSFPGFMKGYTESDDRRYSREQEIGSTGIMYV